MKQLPRCRPAWLASGAAVPHAAANPYRSNPGWGDIGRDWGSTSAVYTTPEGNVWVAERCGENTCVGHDDLDNIFLFDSDGNLLRKFRRRADRLAARHYTSTPTATCG